MSQIVLVDANVLYSRTLRDWLFMLKLRAGGAMFTLHASEDILAETLYHLRRNHPGVDGRHVSGVHDRIERLLDSKVADYAIKPGFPPGDRNDEHVHAAAVACGAHILLTNDRGFLGLQAEQTEGLPYEIYSPDSFFVLIDDSAPDLVDLVAIEQRDYWQLRDDRHSILDALERSGCPRFSERVARRSQGT